MFLEITAPYGRLFLAKSHIVSITAVPKFTEGTVKIKMINGDIIEVIDEEDKKIVQRLVTPTDSY